MAQTTPHRVPPADEQGCLMIGRLLRVVMTKGTSTPSELTPRVDDSTGLASSSFTVETVYGGVRITIEGTREA